MARFGFTAVAWYKAIQRGRLRAAVSVTRYDWAEVQRYYDEGHTFRECMHHFGFAAQAWSKAVQRGDLIARPRRPPLSVILQKSRSRCTIKRRLLLAGMLRNECDICGLSEWRGEPLSIQIDHINGIRDDHRLENLRMLCPNCHSQTKTFAGRNVGRQYSRVV
jgi:HNH endonuclease